MTPTASPILLPAETPPTRVNVAGWAWGLAIAGVWLWTWRHLALAWGAFPNYEYGYAVPFLALYLAWQRLSADPDALSPKNPRAIGGGLFAVVACGAWGGFMLGELLRCIDPVWRPIGLLLMAACTALTTAWLLRTGGWRLLACVAFPLAFTWVAVPWPTFMEASLTKGLKHFVTATNVEALNAIGVAAIQQGNVIDLVGGTVVVDGACSGVNSLQSSLMIALFLGELFRFGFGRRVFLIAAGLGIAICGNMVRTFSLAWLVHREGHGAVERYHDTLGLVAILAIYAAIIALGWLLARSGLPPRPQSLPQAGAMFAAARQSPFAAGFGAVAFLAVPVLALGWFAVSPGGEIRQQHSALFFLRDQPVPPRWKAEPVKLTKTENDALGFSEGEALQLTTPTGAEGTIFHFFWAPNATHATLFYEHTPDVCMPGAGWQLTSPPHVVTVRVGGAETAARIFEFQREGGQTSALQMIWNGGESAVIGKMNNAEARVGRLGLLWKGPRRRGMEVITAFVAGGLDDARRIREVESMLKNFLTANPTADLR